MSGKSALKFRGTVTLQKIILIWELKYRKIDSAQVLISSMPPKLYKWNITTFLNKDIKCFVGDLVYNENCYHNIVVIKVAH